MEFPNMALKLLPLFCLLFLLVASRQILAQRQSHGQSIFHQNARLNDSNDTSLQNLNGTSRTFHSHSSLDIKNDSNLDNQSDISHDSKNDTSLDDQNLTRSGNHIDIRYGNQTNTKDVENDTILQDNDMRENDLDVVQLIARKCCSPDKYFNSSYDCVDKTADMQNNQSLLREFLVKDMLSNAVYDSAITVSSGKLVCHINAYESNEAFIDASSRLCDYNDKCYSSYCIEHQLKEGNAMLTAIAFGCQVYSFRKCCPEDQILSDVGCVEHFHSNVSDSMGKLQDRLPSRIGFPVIDSKPCKLEPWGTRNTDPHWLIDYFGNLQRSEVLTPTEHYCVDDQLQQSGTPLLVAQVCSSEISHTENQYSIGKCCWAYEYLYMYEDGSTECKYDDEIEDIMEHPQVKMLSLWQYTEGYFPRCQNGHLFSYFFDEEELNYAKIMSEGKLDVVNAICGREFSRSSFNCEDYCLDYTQKENYTTGSRRLMALVCIENRDDGKNHSFAFTSTLLGISSIALLFTSISLISERVRRGTSFVRKVKTLTGKILLSYVASLLLAYLALLINQQVSFENGSNGCFTIAGLQLFFLLASFLWNTSICTEMLLLTIGMESRRRDWVRYLRHSLYAWGLPAVITTVAVALDKHRDEMPCVITPRIGEKRCSFSDDLAELLYLYLPIFVSTSANVVMIGASKYIRNRRFKKLASSHPSDPGEGKDGRNPAKKQNSGLRVHQTQNDVATAVRLGIWSGGTWLLEVLIFVVSKFLTTPNGHWYEYLSYIPVAINCLRGVGIFVIIVLTQANRKKIAHTISSHAPALRSLSNFISPITSHLPDHMSYSLNSVKTSSTVVSTDAGVIRTCE